MCFDDISKQYTCMSSNQYFLVCVFYISGRMMRMVLRDTWKEWSSKACLQCPASDWHYSIQHVTTVYALLPIPFDCAPLT